MWFKSIKCEKTKSKTRKEGQSPIYNYEKKGNYVNTYIYNKVFNEYLGEWEMLYNPNFNCTEFDIIKKSNFVNTYI